MRHVWVCRIGLWVWSVLPVFTVSVASAGQPEAEIEHLIKAAAHLEQAGHDRMADDLRQLVAGYDESPKQRLLETKRELLAELQAEIQLLERSLASPATTPKVILRLKVLQLAMGKLHAVGLGLVSIRQLLNSDSPPTLVDDGGDIMQFLQFLEEQGFAEVVSQPTLATTNGRPARFRIDDKQASAEGADPDDGDPHTQRRGASRSLPFECTPTVLSGGTVRMSAGFQLAMAGQAAEADSEKKEPGLSLHESSEPSSSGKQTASSRRPDSLWELVEMKPGQTLIVARPSTARAAPATLVLLQVEVVGHSGT